MLESDLDLLFRDALSAIDAGDATRLEGIGPQPYAAAIVSDWGAGVQGDLYVNAMARGEVLA
jgi:hypothetical protein